MLAAFLFPVLVAAAMSILQFAFSSSSRVLEGENPQFIYSRGLRFFLWSITFLVSIIPISVYFFSYKLRVSDWMFWSGFLFFTFFTSIYGEKYALKFYDDHFMVGAFIHSKIYYRDVTYSNIVPGGQGTRSLLVKTPKKSVAISGWLDNLNQVDEFLKKKVRSAQGV